MISDSLRRVATIALLPVVALTALRVVRRAQSRRAEADLWAEAISASEHSTGT